MEKQTENLLKSSKENIKIVSGCVTIGIALVLLFFLWPKINAELDRMKALNEAIASGESSIVLSNSEIAFEGIITDNNKVIYENIVVGCIFERPPLINGAKSNSMKLKEKKAGPMTMQAGESTYTVHLTDLCPKGDYVQLVDKTKETLVYRGFTIGQKLTILGALNKSNNIVQHARHFGSGNMKYTAHLTKTRKVILFIIALLFCSGLFLIYSYFRSRNNAKE
ncbi:MAG: hypothetical protein ABUK01_16750 [Leptospirales bacterium]